MLLSSSYATSHLLTGPQSILFAAIIRMSRLREALRQRRSAAQCHEEAQKGKKAGSRTPLLSRSDCLTNFRDTALAHGSVYHGLGFANKVAEVLFAFEALR